MNRVAKLQLVALVVLSATACVQADDHSRIFYNFQNLPATTDGRHYEHYADLGHGAIGRMGCFVVEPRSLDIHDVLDGDTGSVAIIRPAVVECPGDCDCGQAKVEDPNQAAGSGLMVTPGTIVGTVDHVNGINNSGGVEFASDLVLDDATSVIIFNQANTPTGASTDSIRALNGNVVEASGVRKGNLVGTSPAYGTGFVSILPYQDGATL